MSQFLKCPQCGANEANLLQDNIYQCKFCGSIYEYGDVKPVYDSTSVRKQQPVNDNTEQTREAAQKIAKIVFGMIALAIFGVSVSVFFGVKNRMNKTTLTSKTTTTSANLYKSSESNSSFTVVNSNDGPQLWSISRRNSDGLTTVDYYLNHIDPVKRIIITSTQIGSTITWEQSNSDAYRMNELKQIGKICWLIYGEKLIGYDVNDGTEIVNNETLKRQFPELKNGIAKVEELYDMQGYKLTTKDGYTYYYAVVQDKLFTEKQYDAKNTTEINFTNKTEYCFTDNERQQLYKINRKAGNIFDNKMNANIVTGIAKEDGEWYKRVYKINTAEDFTPGEIYFKASVLYYDSSKIVIIYQKELGVNSPIIVKCLDVTKKELWSKTGEDGILFKPFLKSTNAESFLHGNQLTIIQPYQIAICLNIENSDINWSFKPY